MATIPPSPSDNLWTEPASPASVEDPPKYPYNNVQQSESGHSFEMDDTPQRERVRLAHRSGTFIEMHPNGDEVHKVYGDGYEIVIKNKNVLIKGTCNITVEGNCNMEVKGDFNQQVMGDYNLLVAGRTNIRSVKDMSISGDEDVSITASEQFGGTMNLGAGDSLYLASDLVVGGSITGDIINSTTRVNAGTGVYAGPLGFVSGLGGLSLGVPSPTAPVAVPGCIYTVGSINSLTFVDAPLGLFGIMDAVLMTDVVNTKIYGFHTHVGNRGFPTSPPNIPMV